MVWQAWLYGILFHFQTCYFGIIQNLYWSKHIIVCSTKYPTSHWTAKTTVTYFELAWHAGIWWCKFTTINTISTKISNAWKFVISVYICNITINSFYPTSYQSNQKDELCDKTKIQRNDVHMKHFKYKSYIKFVAPHYLPLISKNR